MQGHADFELVVGLELLGQVVVGECDHARVALVDRLAGRLGLDRRGQQGTRQD
jgi:hypothetical protein